MTDQTITPAQAPIFAWLYPTATALRLTIGPHIDEPLEELDVRTYHEGRAVAKLYDARPRNF